MGMALPGKNLPVDSIGNLPAPPRKTSYIRSFLVEALEGIQQY
jgi:hypothetical protein